MTVDREEVGDLEAEAVAELMMEDRIRKGGEQYAEFRRLVEQRKAITKRRMERWRSLDRAIRRLLCRLM